MRQAVIALAVLVVSGLPGAAPGGATPKPPPELLVLEDLIGTWDEVMTNKPSEWLPKAEKATSVTKRAWSLGGKLLRAEGTWQPAKTECLHLICYDPGAEVYRSWYFDA